MGSSFNSDLVDNKASYLPTCIKGTHDTNPGLPVFSNSLRSCFTAWCNAGAAIELSGAGPLMRHGYTSPAISGASLSLIDHIVAITLQYPAANIPAAKCTASSGRFSSPVAVWHAERYAKSALQNDLVMSFESVNFPSWR